MCIARALTSARESNEIAWMNFLLMWDFIGRHVARGG